MRFFIEDLEVLFPYDYVYPEQYKYMLELKRTLDAGGHCLLEMPTGTGKTVTLLSLCIAYKAKHPNVGKLLYCTRTVGEMEKCLEECRTIVEYRQKELSRDKPEVLALGLSARRNMCIHERVSSVSDRASCDAECRKLTASWVRERQKEHPEVELCQFYEDYITHGSVADLPSGVFSIDDVREYGKKNGWCPYFTARHLIKVANVVVFNYSYLLDPKVSLQVSREMERECIVVFDEAHNIDNVCIEALSVNVKQLTLESASRNLSKLNTTIKRFKENDEKRLQEEYNRLVQGLNTAGAISNLADEHALSNPAIPEHVLNEAVPGNIRKAEHFVSFLRRFVEYLKQKLQETVVKQETPTAFLHDLMQQTEIEAKPLRFAADRLASLLLTLEISDVDEFTPLVLVADFATLVATYTKGFTIIMEPFDARMPQIPDPVIQLSCMDASLAIKPVFEKYFSVIITSGTLSPIDLYPKILNVKPVTINSLPMSLDRNCFCPIIVTRGSDQLAMTTKYDQRDDPAVVRNYGHLLTELAANVPDGIVCFFTSYVFMEDIVCTWNEMGMLNAISKHKLIFIETTDIVETTLALENFKHACDCGRGAIFLSVARGKVAEGIDFDKHYGRAVVLFGVPFQYTKSRILQARLQYLRDQFHVRETDYLAFDAIRQSAQCVGRVIRSKNDYGLMVFADQRYNKADKRSKLPQWITQHLNDGQLNLSTDMAIGIARQFMREMAQPVSKSDQKGTTLWDENDILQVTAREQREAAASAAAAQKIASKNEGVPQTADEIERSAKRVRIEELPKDPEVAEK